MNHPLQEYYFRPRRVCLPPFIPQFGKGTRPPKPRYGGPKMSYHRARVIVDSGGNLRNVLSMGCASNSESGFSDDPDITIIKRKIFKRVKRDDNRNIVDNPAIKLSRFKNLKPKVGFKAKLGTKNAILVEIVREIYRFIKFAPNRRKLMYNEKIIPFYNVYNWGPVRKKTAATRVDGLFLLLKQMMDNAPDHPCEPMCFSRNRDICGSFYIGAPDNLGGQLYGRWLNDYRKNTKMSHHKKIIYPLVHECQGDKHEATQVQITVDNKRLNFYFIYNPPRNKCDLSWLENLWDNQTLVMGDFNAHSPRWGYKSSDTTGSIVENFIDSRPVVYIENADKEPTFFAYNGQKTHPDLVLSHPRLENKLSLKLYQAP
nr:uncharacterized protein LOC112211272 [Halyomorpha halys]